MPDVPRVEPAASPASSASLLTTPVVFVAGSLLGVSTLAFFRIPLLPDIGDDLSLSAVEVGAITVFFALGRLFTDLPAGRFADRHQAAISYVYAGLAMAVGSAMLMTAPANYAAWAAAFVIGIGSSIANTTGMSYFSRIGDRSNRGRYMAVFSTALLGGQTLGPTLGGAIAVLGGWRISQLVAAISALVIAAICLWAGVRRPARLGFAVRIPEAERSEETGMVADEARIPILERVTILSIGFSIFFTTGGMTQTLIPLIGDDQLALSATMIGFALGLGGLFRLVGGLVGGFVSDHHSRKAALIPGLSLPAVGVLTVAFWPNPAGWLIAIALISVGSIGIASAGAMLGDRTGKGRSGRAFGQFRFFGDLGLLAGPLVSTVLFSEVGYKSPLILTATLLFGSAAASAAFLSEIPQGEVP